MTRDENYLPSLRYNQTSHDCPLCKKQWIDKQSTPGLIHSTILCKDCRQNGTNRDDKQYKPATFGPVRH